MRLESFKYITLIIIGCFSVNSFAEGVNTGLIGSENYYPLLFSDSNNLDISSTDISQTDISTTDIPLTPQEYKDIILQSLKQGLNHKALKNLVHIEEIESEQTFRRYIRALALSNLGQFKKSFDILSRIAIETSSFQEGAQKLSNQLKLTLAEKAFNNQQWAEASQWINSFNINYNTSQNNQYINRIQRKLNRISLKAEGLNLKNKGTPFKIAFLVPLTGAYQEIGQQLLAAAQLALFHSPNPNILLYPQDTNSTEIGSIRAAQKAINDRADIILGPLTALNTQAIISYTSTAGIPVISLSSDNKIAQPNSIILGYSPEEQAQKMAQYAADNNLSTIAILAPNNDYGIRMSHAFQEASFTYDISISQVLLFDETSPDQTVELKKLAHIQEAQTALDEERQKLEAEYQLVGEAMDDVSLSRIIELKTAAPQPIIEFDALYLPVSAEKLPLIASQLAYYNMDSKNVTLLGTAQWQNPSLYKNKAEYLRGAFFPAPPRLKLERVYAEFKKTYNKEAQPLTVLAYDGITLLTQLYQESTENVHFITDTLFKEEGYPLSGGLVRFHKDGTSSRLYSIYEVGRYQSNERRPAPTQFPPKLPQNIDPREQNGYRSFFNPWGF